VLVSDDNGEERIVAAIFCPVLFCLEGNISWGVCLECWDERDLLQVVLQEWSIVQLAVAWCLVFRHRLSRPYLCYENIRSGVASISSSFLSCSVLCCACVCLRGFFSPCVWVDLVAAFCFSSCSRTSWRGRGMGGWHNTQVLACR